MNDQATDRDSKLSVFSEDHYFPYFVKANPIASLLDLLIGISGVYVPKKVINECLLPGCNNLTKHNGGYCCAEHCKQDRERIKNDRKKKL